MPRKAQGPRIGTLAVHGGTDRDARAVDAPVVSPIVQAVSFVQALSAADGLRYPRYGNAPNAEVVQRRLAAIEGAEAALVLGSGMGATACALLALLRPGDHVVASSWIYGGTRVLLLQELASLGIDVTLVDPLEPRVWRKATRKGDAERGPAVYLNVEDAKKRLLNDGELAWVYGPRRHELATVHIDDRVTVGDVVLRDILGASPSEIVRVVKPDLDTRGRNVFA